MSRRDPKIYLSGKMSGISLEEAMVWRNKFINEYSKHTSFTPDIFNPPLYFNYEMPVEAFSDRECFRYEMRILKTSDIVVVNLDQVETSIGSLQELAVAWANDIPVIAVDEKHDTLEEAVEDMHPWLVEEIDKIFTGPDCYRAAATYIYSFYGGILT